MSKERFIELKYNYFKIEDKIDRAVAYFIISQCSFNCHRQLKTGYAGKNKYVFSLLKINNLLNYYFSGFKVGCLDFRQSIVKHKNSFLYLDPPYYCREYLYEFLRKEGAHRYIGSRFHEDLFSLLHRRDNWILSYGDCKEIRYLYKKHLILSFEWMYSTRTFANKFHKKKVDSVGKEILIFSRNFKPMIEGGLNV